ncbi:MAG: hypothetical protein EAY65_07090 [Alphaproteobacteria bacterium]|nr:MAG: hypothetical protein EAY65_07090 [Alphaproteobacteria bacterium]
MWLDAPCVNEDGMKNNPSIYFMCTCTIMMIASCAGAQQAWGQSRVVRNGADESGSRMVRDNNPNLGDGLATTGSYARAGSSVGKHASNGMSYLADKKGLTQIAKDANRIGRFFSGSAAIAGVVETNGRLASAILRGDPYGIAEHGSALVAQGAWCAVGSATGGATGCANMVNTSNTVRDWGKKFALYGVDKYWEAKSSRETEELMRLTDIKTKEAVRAAEERKRQREANQAFQQRMAEGAQQRAYDAQMAEAEYDSDADSGLFSSIMQGVGVAANVATPMLQNQALMQQQQFLVTNPYRPGLEFAPSAGDLLDHVQNNTSTQVRPSSIASQSTSSPENFYERDNNDGCSSRGPGVECHRRK